MKKLISFIILSLVLLACPNISEAKKKVDKQQYMKEWSNYEVATNAVGDKGTKSLKVWGYGKKVDNAIEQAKKNAIHACLFRGIPGSANAQQTPAIFNNQGKGQVAIENFDYFYDFFEGNQEYLQFVNITSDGYPSGQDRREVKGGYKVALNVQVMYDNLREKMKADGILKSASDKFNY